MKTVRCCWILLGLLPLLLPAQTRNSTHTLRLDDGGTPPAATLADFAWLAGHWVGTGFGGAHVEEFWMPPQGSSMAGVFRLVSSCRAQVYEIVALVQVGGTVEMRLKHFTAELRGWEQRDDYVTFRLVRHAPGEACFEGLTFRREDDGQTLRVWLVTSHGETRTEQEMVYRRVK